MHARPALTRAFVLPTVLLAIASIGPGFAQQRTDPAAAATERKAFNAVQGPDAEYVLLSDRYTLSADGSVVHERTSRLQVNSYLAINRRYGESKVDYDPAIETFEVITNRTVLPSGQVVEAPANAVVDDQPSAAEGNPLWSGLRRKILVHTALEPGAVIEEAYRITLKAEARPWLDFGEPLAAELPIRERVVAWDVPKSASQRVTASASIVSVMPTVSEKDGRAVWTLRRDGVPAIPDEPGAPPRSETLPFLWVSTCDWEEAAVEFGRRIEAAGPAPESAVAAANQAMARETAWEPRLLAALTAISGSLNVSGITPALQHWQIKPLADIWRSGYATPLELATLEAKVLRAAGFSADVALLAPPGRTDKAAPGFAGFDRALLRLTGEDGTPRLYDPAGPAAGVPLEARISGPLLVPRHPGFEAAPTSDPTRRDLTLVAEVAADGGLSGSLALVATGAATPHAARTATNGGPRGYPGFKKDLFAICAALSAWNPLAAPAGLIVGIGAVLIAWRAAVREEGRTRRIAICAVALGGGAVVASAVVLLLSSGMLSRNLPEQAVVPGRAPNEVKRLLEEAERRTEAAAFGLLLIPAIAAVRFLVWPPAASFKNSTCCVSRNSTAWVSLNS